MIEHSAMKFDQKLQRWARSQNTVLDHKKFTRQTQRQSDYRSKKHLFYDTSKFMSEWEKNTQAQGRKKSTQKCWNSNWSSKIKNRITSEKCMKCSELTKGNTFSHKVTDELVRTCRRSFNVDLNRKRPQNRRSSLGLTHQFLYKDGSFRLH